MLLELKLINSGLQAKQLIKESRQYVAAMINGIPEGKCESTANNLDKKINTCKEKLKKLHNIKTCFNYSLTVNTK